MHTAVLVEGLSDEAAVHALAARHGRDLGAEGVAVVAMGGATNVGAYARRLGPAGLGLRLAGLCDEGEAGHFLRALGDGAFFVCAADLEDELIRALGNDAVERLLDAEGDLASFRAFQKQPAQRDRPEHAQLRRFFGTRSGRKIRYGRLLVDALADGPVPAPLSELLARIS